MTVLARNAILLVRTREKQSVLKISCGRGGSAFRSANAHFLFLSIHNVSGHALNWRASRLNEFFLKMLLTNGPGR